MSKCPNALTESLQQGTMLENEESWKEEYKDRSLTNIIRNVKMTPIVIMDIKIKFNSSDVSMTGASIGWCQAAGIRD